MKNLKEGHPERSIFRDEPLDSEENSGRVYPAFGSFRESPAEEYEEPERDTDYFSGYNPEEEHEEEEQDDLFPSWDGEQTTVRPLEKTPSPEPVEIEPTADHKPDESVDWSDEEEYFEPNEDDEPAMPLRLIAVAGLALLLLVVGAYGVLQERAGMQEELRELRASLATGVNESDVREARGAFRDLQESYDSLAAEVGVLSQENLELKEVVASLESAEAGAVAGTQAPKAKAQAEPTRATAASKKVPSPAPAAPKKPAAAASAPTGSWFVNFGSYSSRETAQSWASKLKPVQGEVVVVSTAKDNQTYFRVRVVGMNSKKAADLVARQLEAELQVSRLWVGQQ